MDINVAVTGRHAVEVVIRIIDRYTWCHNLREAVAVIPDIGRRRIVGNLLLCQPVALIVVSITERPVVCQLVVSSKKQASILVGLGV